MTPPLQEPSLDAPRAVELSVVSPAYNESRNLPALHLELCQALDPLGIAWEWIIVDDHSLDETSDVVDDLASADPRIRGFRLARNSGSHLAIACGLEQSLGACVVVLASDLQDPPEIIPSLLDRWRAGDQIVWAVRAEREGETRTTILFSRLYYAVMRHFVGLKSMPPTGADFFLADRLVIDALNRCRERNISLFALLTWLGFRQSFLPYIKVSRRHGRSQWTLAMKVRLVLDSVIAFTDLPIRMITATGAFLALLGFSVLGLLGARSFAGHAIQGWTMVLGAVIVLSGLQTTAMGILGEYLWRAYDESRDRPRYMVEHATNARFARSRPEIRRTEGPGQSL